MRLPRLRVRQMIFLVVYAALIGNALLDSFSGRVVTHPSNVPGYVWVMESDAQEIGAPRVAVEIIRQGIVGIEVRGARARVNGKAHEVGLPVLIEGLLGNPSLSDGRWVLLPEDALR